MIVHPQIQQGYMKTTKKKEDLAGRVFQKLTVLGFSHQDSRRRRYYLYRCECGREGASQKNALLKQQSCGKCEHHGRYSTPEWKVWRGIKDRCLNPNSKSFAHYGGRGIKVSDEWMKFEAFQRDMGERPGPDHEIDRIDNNGNYEKGNCRWVTRSVNAKNRLNSNFWHIKGLVFESKSQAARHFGVSAETIANWAHGLKSRGGERRGPPRKDCYAIPKYENIL